MKFVLILYSIYRMNKWIWIVSIINMRASMNTVFLFVCILGLLVVFFIFSSRMNSFPCMCHITSFRLFLYYNLSTFCYSLYCCWWFIVLLSHPTPLYPECPTHSWHSNACYLLNWLQAVPLASFAAYACFPVSPKINTRAYKSPLCIFLLCTWARRATCEDGVLYSWFCFWLTLELNKAKYLICRLWCLCHRPLVVQILEKPIFDFASFSSVLAQYSSEALLPPCQMLDSETKKWRQHPLNKLLSTRHTWRQWKGRLENWKTRTYFFLVSE